MLIVITSEQEIHNEALLLNQLFEAGLEVLHLRKPSFSKEQYMELLNKIEKRFYNRIMLHEYHELCEKYSLKGIHLQEQPRINLERENLLLAYVKQYKSKGHWVSSSFHEPNILEVCTINFDYHLLSPVFSSISKKGYEGRGFNVKHIDKIIIGMGGINEATINKALALGYKGIGVLGGVWNKERPVLSFKKLIAQFNSVI